MSFVRAVRLRVPAGSAKPGPALGTNDIHSNQSSHRISCAYTCFILFYPPVLGQALGPLGTNDICYKLSSKALIGYTFHPILSSFL